jgi:hypothetical protein
MGSIAAQQDASDASSTYSNVWIILRAIFMLRGGLALLARRRWRAVFLFEEGQDLALLLLLLGCGFQLRGLHFDGHLVVGRGCRGEGAVRVAHDCGGSGWSWSGLWLLLDDEEHG